jgi:hypothetical protein
MRSTEGKPESHYVRSQIGLLILQQHDVPIDPSARAWTCACGCDGRASQDGVS